MTPDDIEPFNPLDKKNLGRSVADALLQQEPVPLADIKPFAGAGIYAIYYTGDFPAYEPITRLNVGGAFSAPIYVGKAIPTGARRGADLSKPAGKVLHNRLKQHAKSLDEAGNLQLGDFYCRYLVVDDIWIPLVETLLIAMYSPLWNKFVDGFGNHDPGTGRHKGLRPIWDTIHPGRGWAAKCTPREESPEELIRAIGEYLRSNPPT